MNTSISQTTYGWDSSAFFGDENLVNEGLNESTHSPRDATLTSAWIANLNIGGTWLMLAGYFEKIREETDFVPAIENTRNISTYPVEDMFSTSRISTENTISSRLESLISDLNSLHSRIDFSSFENILMSLENLGFNKCAERIKYLRSDDAVEDGDEPLSLESAQGFVKLMEDFQDLGEPLLGLFSQGTLGVEWRVADNKHLLVEPFDSERACFAFIGPSTEPGEKIRLNGRGSITDVIKTLRKEGVDQWQNV